MGGWRPPGLVLVVLPFVLLVACDTPGAMNDVSQAATVAPDLSESSQPSAPSPAEVSSTLNPRDNPMILVENDPSRSEVPTAREVRLAVVLSTLHVQVPRSERLHAESVWNHLREDLFDVRTFTRLEKNGMRVGAGNARWWNAIQTVLNSIPGVRSVALDPVRLPPNYPLSLELDTEPQDQTLFWVEGDGIFSGESWPHSRNVLRVSYDLHLEDPEKVRMVVVPEVRQSLKGWKWIRSDVGLTQMPQYHGRSFEAAGFWADVKPGEFLLVAPNEAADVGNVIGGAFLVQAPEGRTYDSYVFLRVDVNHVAQRN
jgi:hypothetical protein